MSNIPIGWALRRALQIALKWAHNINDPTFCARTTARVNAMCDGWNPPPAGAPDPRASAARLLEASAASEFACLHYVGETYANRDPARTVPLPDSVRTATTLADLARVYERPLNEFLSLNPGVMEHEVLLVGTAVNVPDPGYAPFIATCLAAQAIADESLGDGEAAGVIHALVPLATRDLTAFDTLLSRLLLSSAPQDLDALKRLQQLAAASRAEIPDFDSPPPGELAVLPA
jgi:hypothetical protein